MHLIFGRPRADVSRVRRTHRRGTVPIRVALAVVLGAMLVAPIATGALGWVFLARTSDSYERVNERLDTLSANVDLARQALGAVGDAAERLATLRAPFSRFDSVPFDSGTAAFQRRLLPLQRLGDADRRRAARAIAERWRLVGRIADAALARRRSLGSHDFPIYVVRGEVRLSQQALGDIERAGRSDVARQRGDANRRKQTELFALLALLGVGGIGAAWSVRILMRLITRPLQELTSAAGRLAEGDLAQRVPVERDDEFGRLARAFNAMAERLAASRAELSWQAYHDRLTGLPNRALFADRARTALARTLRTGGSIGVVLIDLDSFKSTNDTLGHQAGDRLLVEVARRLSSSLRAEDTVARLGGDEFAMLIADASDRHVVLGVAGRAHAELARPAFVNGVEVSAAASLGIYRSVAGDDVDDCLRRADTAMYAAKARGKNRIQEFEPAMEAALSARGPLDEGPQPDPHAAV